MKKSFECECSYFEGDAMTNRQPMKFLESRSDMIMTLDKRHDNTGERVLNSLKAVYGSCWETIIQGVAIVQFGSDKGVGQYSCRVGVECRTNLMKLSDVMIGGLTDGGDMSFEG